MKLDSKRVCRAIESAIGYPEGLSDDQGSWLGLRMHADGPKSKIFTIHALSTETVSPAEHWKDAVVAVLTKQGICPDSIAIQELSAFEDVAKEEARPCSALLSFLNGEPELVAKLRTRKTTLIAAEVSRKERLLLWFLFGEKRAGDDT